MGRAVQSTAGTRKASAPPDRSRPWARADGVYAEALRGDVRIHKTLRTTLAMAANVGSTATITGNPQNIIVGAVAQIPYTAFAVALTPVAFAGIVLVIILLAVLYRAEFRRPAQLAPKPSSPRLHKPQMMKAVLVALGVIIAFFAGVSVAKAAILGGALLLITRAIKARKVYREIDGSLLLMFTGLFVVVAAAEKNLFTPEVVSAAQAFHLDNAYVLTTLTALLSNVISNVPAVLTLKPFVQGLADQTAFGSSSR